MAEAQSRALAGRLGGEEGLDRPVAATSGGMPVPVSVTAIITYSRRGAASRFRHVFVVDGWHWLASM